MAALYIHIPFCKKKCSYCDFYSVANLKLTEDFLLSLLKEIEIKADIFKGKKIKTIYFGGGTPSVLSIKQINNIFNRIYKFYNTDAVQEISFEANPEDLDIEYLNELYKTPVNRISIGVQADDDNILKFLKRNHTNSKALESVENAHKVGFVNICSDLIYGISGLTEEKWVNTLNNLLSYPIKHLSAYHLGIEEGTLLYKMLLNNKISEVSEDLSINHYKSLIEISEKHNFYQYEISNFAKKGYKSVHNSLYWTDEEYIGFGPSAHSYYMNKRTWNSDNIKKYIQQISNNEFCEDEEYIDETKQLNEYILKKTRLTDGINFDEFKRKFGSNNLALLKSNINKIDKKYYNKNHNSFKLNSQGLFVSDNIVSILTSIMH